jgi:hypothetical protein
MFGPSDEQWQVVMTIFWIGLCAAVLIAVAAIIGVPLLIWWIIGHVRVMFH